MRRVQVWAAWVCLAGATALLVTTALGTVEHRDGWTSTAAALILALQCLDVLVEERER